MAEFLFDTTHLHFPQAYGATNGSNLDTLNGTTETQTLLYYSDQFINHGFRIVADLKNRRVPVPATFRIETDSDASVDGNHTPADHEDTIIKYVADSGVVAITSLRPDSVIGWVSVRLRGSDSSIHHLSGNFISTPPAVP